MKFYALVFILVYLNLGNLFLTKKSFGDSVVLNILSEEQDLSSIDALNLKKYSIGVFDLQKVFDSYYLVAEARNELSIEKDFAIQLINQKREILENFVEELKDMEVILQAGQGTDELEREYQEMVNDAKAVQDDMVSLDETLKTTIAAKQNSYLEDHLEDIIYVAQQVASRNDLELLINSAQETLGVIFSEKHKDYSQEIVDILNDGSGFRSKINLGNNKKNMPIVNGWFYIPKNGWMWTNSKVYPHVYSQKKKSWIYFQGGDTKPKFYDYENKKYFEMD